MTQTTQEVLKRSRKGIGVIEIKPLLANKSFLDENNSNHTQQWLPFSESDVHHIFQTYPFGFRTPENCSCTPCRWIYPITFGGGLVGGDEVEAAFDIGERCCVVVCTQEFTKVYHCLESEETSQIMDFKLKKNSLLCVLPDPLVCYQDARFCQKQTFHMCSSSNLVMLDWMMAGRKALGENWHFKRYCNSIEVYLEEKLVLRECNDLENTPQIDMVKCMKKYEFMGTCIILGNYLTSIAKKLEEIYGQKKAFAETQSDKLVVSVSPLSYSNGHKHLSGCFLRFLASDLKQASLVIRDITNPLLGILGSDPFERKL